MSEDALKSITISGFKSIASMEALPLRAINVVIGPNGSGKSNFLGAFSFLHAISEGKLKDYVTIAGGAEKVLHFGSKTTKEIELGLTFQDRYELTLSPTADDGLYPSKEEMKYRQGSEDAPLYPSEEVIYRQGEDGNPLLGIGLNARQQGREAGISEPQGIGHQINKHLSQWRVYHLNDTSSSSPLRKTARIDDNRFLRFDGSNLPAFLYCLRLSYEDSYRLIVRAVQRVAPFFDDFLLEPLQRKPDDIKLEWRHKLSDQYFDASSLSDGTLRFMALATLFLQPEKYRPSVILVDEPELGLHPYALEMLAALVRQASVTSQVIVSTQSSLLLDHFEPEDVLVADRVNDHTQLKRLESPQLAEWLKDYSLGQLWEKNELGGRPVPA